jgi:hypothetical protein
MVVWDYRFMNGVFDQNEVFRGRSAKEYRGIQMLRMMYVQYLLLGFDTMA